MRKRGFLVLFLGMMMVVLLVMPGTILAKNGYIFPNNCQFTVEKATFTAEITGVYYDVCTEQASVGTASPSSGEVVYLLIKLVVKKPAGNISFSPSDFNFLPINNDGALKRNCSALKITGAWQIVSRAGVPCFDTKLPFEEGEYPIEMTINVSMEELPVGVGYLLIGGYGKPLLVDPKNGLAF